MKHLSCLFDLDKHIFLKLLLQLKFDLSIAVWQQINETAHIATFSSSEDIKLLLWTPCKYLIALQLGELCQQHPNNVMV